MVQWYMAPAGCAHTSQLLLLLLLRAIISAHPFSST
jgi:hypothetical protein